MKDLLGLMGKAKEMQAKFQAMQEEVASLEATGQAGGGLVSVTLSGKFDMKSIKIDPSLFKEDEVEILEDLLLGPRREVRAGRHRQAARHRRRDPGDRHGEPALGGHRDAAQEPDRADEPVLDPEHELARVVRMRHAA